MPIALIDPADIAAVAAVALTSGAGPELELSGPEALTPGQQVAILAEVLDRPLRYEPQPDAEARAELLAGGTPEPIVDALFRFFSAGEYDDSRVVGHGAQGHRPNAGTLRRLGRRACG